ncbi:hypothetical protein N431DRAFT_456722 [Stipitochalara longipes BDJ]|nr:hypothetical protein N431DRAFT_456722 [Stipitochalara longipes BDJ]
MDGASAIAGIIGLAALVLQTTLQVRTICEEYSTAKEDVNRVSEALQSLQNLLEETQRLAGTPEIVNATVPLTRSRLKYLLTNCEKELRTWIHRIENAIPQGTSRARQRWKKIIVAVDKPKLTDLASKVLSYNVQIQAMLAIMQGDLGVSTNTAVVSVVSMLWSEGVYKFDYHKQLDAIQASINTLKSSQQGFERRTFGKLDPMASAITSIDMNVQELLFRNVNPAPRATTFDRGHLVIPFVRNGNFVGRRAILDSVERKLVLPTSNNRIALRGLGGVGKSQIALEFAYRAQNLTPGVSCFWVSAVSRSTFTRSYRQIASSCAIPGTSNPSNNMLQLVKDYLQKEQAGPWLMMVDNIDDLRSLRGEIDENDSSDLLDYLPQCTHGKLLFTTRSKEAALALTGSGSIVEVPAMDADEAQKLLRGKLDDDNDDTLKQDCLELVMALEYLPLPISHAASYIREMDSTPAKYLRMFNDDRKRTKLLKHRYDDLARDGEQNSTVLTTWGISFKQIQRDSSDSGDLLRIMGSLHWQDIPQFLLQQEKLEDEDDFDEAVSPLLAFSLIQKSSKLKTFSMHRLVNIAIRSWSESREWERTAQRLLVQVFPVLEANQISGGKNLKCRQLLQHAQKVSDSLDSPISPDSFSPMAVKLKSRIASYLFVSWQWQEARNLFEKLIAPVDGFALHGIDVGISPAELEDKITGIYFSQCLESEAVNRAKKAYETRKRTLPADHPDTLRAIDLFSLALICQGKLTEAETALREAYSLIAERRTKTDMLSITLLLSLGAVYAAMGQYHKAVDTYKQVLDTLMPLYGEKNDCVIKCLGAMADSLYNLNSSDEARVLIHRALALSEETLGPDHPVTLGIVARLANQIFPEDRPAAFKLRERVWQGHRRLYGDDLNITLMSLSLYAAAHPSPVESERLLKEAIGRASRLSGGKASGLLMNLEDTLADFYGVETMDGKGNDGVYSHGEATTFCRQLVWKRTKFLGPSARGTLRAMQKLGLMLGNEAKLEESETLLKTAMEGQTKLLGPVHVDTWRTKDVLSLTARRLWHWDISEAIAREQIKFSEETKGPFNCHTLSKKGELGNILSLEVIFVKSKKALVRAKEGCVIMTEAYENLVKYYGEEHSMTVAVARNLAMCHVGMGNTQTCRSISMKLAEIARKKTGDESEAYLDLEAQVALSWITEKNFDEAYEIYKRIQPIQLRVGLEGDAGISAVWMGLCLAYKAILAEDEAKLLEAYNFSQTELIKVGKVRIMRGTRTMWGLILVVNAIRDAILILDTDWQLPPSFQSSKFLDFESYFPFPHQTIEDSPVKQLRRAKSWHLLTAKPRLYQKGSPRERECIIRTLREGLPDEIQEPEPGVECMRCHKSMPYPAYFYSCNYTTTCAQTWYAAAICDSCHRKGLHCTNFSHPPVRTRAFSVCKRCNHAITDTYMWRCDICESGKYEVCWKCYTSGPKPGHGCLVEGHRLYKRLQRCYKGWDWDYNFWECNRCGDDMVPADPHWHCEVCNEGDYDICLPCHTQGVGCEDPTHVLTKFDRS